MLKSIMWWTCSAVPILMIALVIAAYLAYRRKRAQATEQWRRRSPMSDDEFLRRCDLPADPFSNQVGLAARRAAASLATVPPETILPDDSVSKDLAKLPFWDSLDWLGYVLEVEKESGFKAKITGGIAAGAVKAAGGREDLKVKHLVRSVVTSAHPWVQPDEPAATNSTR